jgi:hypothetical protein
MCARVPLPSLAERFAKTNTQPPCEIDAGAFENCRRTTFPNVLF